MPGDLRALFILQGIMPLRNDAGLEIYCDFGGSVGIGVVEKMVEPDKVPIDEVTDLNLDVGVITANCWCTLHGIQNKPALNGKRVKAIRYRLREHVTLLLLMAVFYRQPLALDIESNCIQLYSIASLPRPGTYKHAIVGQLRLRTT